MNAGKFMVLVSLLPLLESCAVEWLYLQLLYSIFSSVVPLLMLCLDKAQEYVKQLQLATKQTVPV